MVEGICLKVIMMAIKLEDVNWKDFEIQDVFETVTTPSRIQVPTGAYIKKDNLKEGEIPRITVRDTNNGVDGFYDSHDKNYRLFSNIITVSFLGSVFYQPGTVSLDMKVHSLRTKEIKLNKNIAMFLIACLKNNTEKSSYGNQISSTDLPRMRILLPITNTGDIYWDFMYEYIAQEKTSLKINIQSYYNSQYIELKKDLSLKYQIFFNTQFDDLTWEVFDLNDIFDEIERGKRLKKDDHVKGYMPYVSSTAFNNGVDDFIGNADDVKIFSNTLSLNNSGSVGEAFYHTYSFVASDHVTQLKREDTDKYTYLFLASIVSRLKEKYSFNREINNERINRERIILPVDDKKEPYWDYMEYYMKKIQVELLENLGYSVP